MRAVSGTSGAAPVWREVMMALQGERLDARLPMPARIEARRVAFVGVPERPRREFFLTGTGQTLFAAAPVEARRPRIVNPVAGSVYVLDPDMPAGRQQLAIGVTGATSSNRVLLDQHDLGSADANPAILPLPGRHWLRLVDTGGAVVDRVMFTVR